MSPSWAADPVSSKSHWAVTRMRIQRETTTASAVPQSNR